MLHYSFTTLYLAVTCSVSGCCLWNTEIWILREMTSSMGACLARLWIYVLCQFGFLAVTCSVSGCCMRNTENWVLQEISSLGLTVNTNSASVRVASGRILYVFYDEMDSNLVASSPFSRRMEKSAQQMPQFPVQLPMHTFGIFSSHSTWRAAVMMARIFWGTCVRHRCRVVPAPRESVSSVCRHMLHN